MKKKEDARLAILREYDGWAKDNPNDAKKMGGYVFFASVPPANGKSFTCGFVTQVD